MKKILYVLGIVLLAASAVLYMRGYWEEEIIALINQYIEQKPPAAGLTMPDSEVDYPGASATNAFFATEPYVVNIQGVPTTSNLWGSSRSYDFSGNVPFINTGTGKADAAQIQAWDPVFATSHNPPLSGSYNLDSENITNAGFNGRVDKRTINGSAVTMVRYNAYDGVTEGKCRSQLLSYDVPSRTHVRWELEVAFGNADGMNDWVLTPTGASPVLFWQLYSMNQSNPPLAANVDTDSNDPTKLMITFFQRVGTATKPTQIGVVNGIPRYTMVPIVIETFLDERETANGGKGLLRIWVNNALVLEKAGPTLSLGPNPHWWDMAMYLWNEANPYQYTRSSFWKTARMLVFPVSTTTADTTPPSVPLNLAATSPDSSKVYLSWSASTDNVGVAGYKIYRDDTQIGINTVASLTDTAVTGGTTYNYSVKASDVAGNLSASSQTVTVVVNTPTAAAANVNISSYFVGGITATSALINWTTDVPSSGVVFYGRTTNLGSSSSDTALKTSHSVKITGLSRRTKYYYKITANTTGAVASSSLANFTTTRR